MNYTLVSGEEKSRLIYKIVITGGPCAGKTTAISRIHDEFTAKGYNVILVSETATDLIMGGIAPWTVTSNNTFQRILMRLQLEKEALFASAAEKLKNDGKVLIVFDRGVMDGLAYMTSREAFDAALLSHGLTEETAMARYDAIFHLVTAANGAREFYTLSNNAARTETPEEAIAIDERTVSAWSGHHKLHIIGNDYGFEEKINRLISDISTFLGEPLPFEIERKFLIKHPDITTLESNPDCKKAEIVQTYLKSVDGEEARVRERIENGFCTYTKTVKKKISGIKRIELEKRISKEEYIVELLDADPSKKPVSKTRYCLSHADRVFEIDIYPFWSDKAIMEIELRSEDEIIDFPCGIEIIEEVTNDDRFKNSNLAKTEGAEL